MSYANDIVDRRASTRDRRLFGDRRSIILPNLSDESRRITVTDRRSRFVDRRMQHRVSTLRSLNWNKQGIAAKFKHMSMILFDGSTEIPNASRTRL